MLASSSNDNNNSSSSSANISPAPITPRGDNTNTPPEKMTMLPLHKWNVDGDRWSTVDMYGLPSAYIYDVDTAEHLHSVATTQSSGLLLDGSATEGGEYYPSIVSEFNFI